MSFTALQFAQNSKRGNTFTGVFRYFKTSGVKSTKEGELYGFLQISGEGNFPAERVAHMAWDGVVEGYLYSQSKSVSESLKFGIEEFTRRLKDLMRNSKELEEKGIEVNLVIISVTKGGIYIGNLGENEIFAYKNGKVVNISEVISSHKAQTAGFPISSEDLLVVSTNSFMSENMHTLVGKKSREEIISGINILGKTVLPNQGIFCIYEDRQKEEGKFVVKEKVRREKKKEIISKKEEKNVSVEEKGDLFETEEKEKDSKLKVFLSKIPIWFVSFKAFFKKVFVSIKQFFAKVREKISDFLKQKFGNKKWYKRYAAKSSEIALGRKKTPNIKIDGYKEVSLRTKRLRIVVLAAIAVVVLVGGYQYTRRQILLRDLNTEAEELMDTIENRLESARSSLSTDREGAEMDIFAINNLLSEMPEGVGESQSERLSGLQGEILGVEDDLFRRVSVSPESFVGFFEDNSDIVDMKYVMDTSRNEYLIATDRANRTVWLVNIFDRKKQRIADNDGLLRSPEYVDIGFNRDIYVYDSKVGVLRAPFQDPGWGAFTTITGAGLNNIKVDNVGEFGVFTANDNLYYLDVDTGRLLYSVNYGTGYSSTAIVRIEDERFVNANDFVADFSIYTLTSGSDGIIRHTGGEYNPLTVIGVNNVIGELCCGETRMNLDYSLYVFDRESNRILRFRKPNESVRERRHPNELHLIQQYIYRGSNDEMWANVKEISVDEAEKFMYILDGNAVWRVPL